MQPFVKWVGGKTQVLGDLVAQTPQAFNTYFEPMVGGGALFWKLASLGRLKRGQVVLGDTNENLIETYQEIKLRPTGVLDELERLEKAYYDKGGDKVYYAVREEWNAGMRRSAANFIFLKQTSFNGLWRHNQQGKLNMAWGKYKDPHIFDPAAIMDCHAVLKELDVTLLAGDYRTTLAHAQADDYVYFDPPYLDRFDRYNKESFGKWRHTQLIADCARLSGRGIHVLYSNESSEQIWQWLDRFWKMSRVTSVGSRRFINRDGKGREPVMDVLVYGPWDVERVSVKRLLQMPLPLGADAELAR